MHSLTFTKLLNYKFKTIANFCLNQNNFISIIKNTHNYHHFGNSSTLVFQKLTFMMANKKNHLQNQNQTDNQKLKSNKSFKQNKIQTKSQNQSQLEMREETALQQQFQFLQEDKTKLAIMKIDQLSLQWYINIFNEKFHQRVTHPETTSKTSQQFRKKILSIKQYNKALANGKDFQQYPLQKLLQICLRSLSESQKLNQFNDVKNQSGGSSSGILSYMEWQLMEKLFQKRLFRCSLKQYMKLLYISLQCFSTYRFQHSFIKGLLIGFRKEITLMDQTQVLQLFYILGDRVRPNYNQFKKYQKDSNRVNLFRSEIIQKLQIQILDKIVQKYTLRYSQKNRNILISQQDMQKIVFWIKCLYLFKNDQEVSQQPKQQNDKKTKQDYLIKFLQILTFQLKKKSESFSQQKKDVPASFLTGQQIKYNFLGELVEVLTYSHKILQNKLVSMSNVSSTTPIFNQALSPKLQSLKSLMLEIKYLTQTLFRDNKQMISQQLNFHMQKHSVNQISYGKIYNDLKIVRFAIQQNMFKEIADQKICSKLFQNANIALHTKNMTNEQQSKKQSLNITYQIQNIQLCQNVFAIVYYLWNRKLLDDSQYSYFFSNILSAQFKNQGNFSLFSPGMIRKLINIQYVEYFDHIQFSEFAKISHETSGNYTQIVNEVNIQKILKNVFRNKKFIINFAKQTLKFNQDQDQESQKKSKQNSYSLYVRQLEWPLYNYLKLLHLTIKKFLKIKKIADPQEGQFLESNDKIIEYQKMNKQIQQIIQVMTLRNLQVSRWLKAKSQNTQFKNIVLPSNMIVTKNDQVFNQEIERLSTWIKKVMQSEKKQFQMKSEISEIKKFFISIKTFDIDFGIPVTPFNIISQFSKVNNHFQRTILLSFMSKDVLNKRSKDAIRLMFEVNGFSYSFIDSQAFLKMHINERVQYLIKNVFPGMEESLKFKMKLQNANQNKNSQQESKKIQN